MMRKRILVIDDNEHYRAILRTLLEAMAIDVLAESNGHVGLSRIELEARRAPIDGVLLELQLPIFDGIAVLKELRERRPELPVVVMCDATSSEMLRTSIDRGARGYLTKPITYQALIDMCTRVFLQVSERS